MLRHWQLTELGVSVVGLSDPSPCKSAEPIPIFVGGACRGCPCAYRLAQERSECHPRTAPNLRGQRPPNTL